MHGPMNVKFTGSVFSTYAICLEGNRFWLCEVLYMHCDWLCKYRLICVTKEHPDQ